MNARFGKTILTLAALLIPLDGSAVNAAKQPGKSRPSATRTPTSPPLPTPTSTATPAPTLTPTPTSAPVSSLTCGPTPVYKSDGTPWTCTFDDEFDASALDRSRWVPQESHTSGYYTGQLPEGVACYVDSPNNIAVGNGQLHLTLRQELAPRLCGTILTPFTAGMVSTYNRFSQKYGRFEVRAKIPDVRVKGLQEALWLYPAPPMQYGPWPASGEIDFAEFYSQYPDLMVPYVHYPYDPMTTNYDTANNVVTAYDCGIRAGEFNTYTLVWTPGVLEMKVNGELCLVNRHAASNASASHPFAPFDQPFFVVLTQAIGAGTNAFVAGQTPLPATMSIDYVRVWR